MELYAVQALLHILCGSDRAGFCGGRNGESRSGFRNINSVAHPADCLTGYMFEKCCLIIDIDFGVTVFTDRSRCDFTAEEIIHELGAVADSKYRNTELEDLFAASRCIVICDVARATGEDDTFRIHLFDLFDRHVVRMNFAVNT